MVSASIFRKNTGTIKFSTKNNIKASYSCTDNLQTIIKKHNRKILETNKTAPTENNCNCRKKNDNPMENNRLTSSVIYNANVTTESDTTGKNYIVLTEGTFKQRFKQHKLSFRNRNYSNSTELSKYIWSLKDNNTNFSINWSILATTPAYSNKSINYKWWRYPVNAHYQTTSTASWKLQMLVRKNLWRVHLKFEG